VVVEIEVVVYRSGKEQTRHRRRRNTLITIRIIISHPTRSRCRRLVENNKKSVDRVYVRAEACLKPVFKLFCM
jgi:hypothetical protein